MEEGEKKIRNILEQAIWAPSGENCQPWKFVIRGMEVDLYNFPELDQSLYNFDQLGSMVSHGALLENILILAKGDGLDVSWALFPENGMPDFVARISFSPRASVEIDVLSEYIPKRCSNRKPYSTETLSPEEKEVLCDTQEVPQGYHVTLIDTPGLMKTVAQVASLNERFLFEHPKLHHFFFGHLRWTEQEDKEKTDGFYVRALELAPPQVFAFRIFQHWGIMRVLNKIGFSKIAGKANLKTYLSSSAYIAITVPTATRKDFVIGGQVSQHIWLLATQLGLSVQPMSGVLYFVQQGDKTEFTDNQRALVDKAEVDLRSAFAMSQGEFAMLFRVGRGPAPSARARRFSLEHFVHTTESKSEMNV